MPQTNITLYGTNWCSDCKRSKKFLGEQRVRYEFINIDEDQEGMAFVQKLQNGGMSIPTIEHLRGHNAQTMEKALTT